jgi:hypothetical protein
LRRWWSQIITVVVVGFFEFVGLEAERVERSVEA